MPQDSKGQMVAMGDLVTMCFKVTGVNGPNVTLTGQVPDGIPAHAPVLACDSRLLAKVGPAAPSEPHPD